MKSVESNASTFWTVTVDKLPEAVTLVIESLLSVVEACNGLEKPLDNLNKWVLRWSFVGLNEVDSRRLKLQGERTEGFEKDGLTVRRETVMADIVCNKQKFSSALI